ncbi:hypothetical protein [Hydrogenophaga sp.]|uniref:competence protein CoiA family protein n=1 Tax=Hydrogenophaga sp. TaxID=1904254 RepID=UPI003F6FFAB8
MSKLFIARNAAGEMRFIGEVERGAECGCWCPECGSPLVARQGMANDWHFAHGATQERPECGLAALRLLRRFVIGHLQERTQAAGFTLPAYREEVTLTRSLVHLREEAQWGAEILGDLQWLPEEGEDAPVARARLDSGVDLHVFVQLGDAMPAPVPADSDVARLIFRVRLPPASVYRERRLAVQHLQSAGELVWAHHPDTLGLVRAARERLETRGYRIYSNWLSMVDAKRQALADAAAPAAPLFYGPSSPQGTQAAHRHACAPDHAPNVNFTFYRLNHQEAWLLYLLERVGPSDWRNAQQKFYALAPYPGPFDGWAQALPTAVGLADEALGIVRLTGFLDAVTYLSRRARVTRSHRDPAAFKGL